MASTDMIHVPSNQEIERQRFMPVMSMDLALDRREIVVIAFQKLMKDGKDYGAVPGTGSKPTLLQPGAQKLDNLFGLVPRFIIEEREEDWTGEHHGGEPFFRYLVKCQVWRSDFIMGEAIGECNSWESKYRFRTAERTCPTCHAAAIIKTKKNAWWCARFKGGCGAGFAIGDEAITKQEIGRKPNSEIFDQVNTLLKMAQKRAHVAATINATSASEFFTQDIEDLRESEAIDTNGHPPGTAEARDAVRDRKIAEATGKPSPGKNFAMLKQFGEVKKDLKKLFGNDDVYYQILRENGYEHADKIPDPKTGEPIFQAMEIAFHKEMEQITSR